jgi:hypothetical protein
VGRPTPLVGRSSFPSRHKPVAMTIEAIQQAALRRWRRAAIMLIAVLLSLTLLRVGRAVYEWRLSPGDCATLQCVATSKPSPVVLKEVQLAGRSYIVWLGETKPIWLAPSGPSAYVFDDRGHLLVWSSSTGDGEATERFYRIVYAGKPIALDDALKRLNRE